MARALLPIREKLTAVGALVFKVVSHDFEDFVVFVKNVEFITVLVIFFDFFVV